MTTYVEETKQFRESTPAEIVCAIIGNQNVHVWSQDTTPDDDVCYCGKFFFIGAKLEAMR